MIQKQRLNNKILSLVLALVMVFGMLPVASLTTFAADGDGCKTTDCTGTYTNGICSNGCYEPADLVGDVYQIGNAGQLYWFAQEVNGGNTSINAMLTENIVINEKVLDDDGSLVDDTAALRVWTPIGNAYFRGIFDGDGHTISGLYEEKPGLFYILGAGGTVKNVGIINSYTKDAGIVYYNQGVISGCWVADSLISGDTYTGSIVCMNNGTVENCWSDATVQTTGFYSGGLVGNNSGIISNCCNLGTTSGGTDVGAIAGHNDTNASVINCYFISDNFSGAVGYNQGSVDELTGGMTNVAARVIAGGEIYYFSDLQQAFDSTAVKSSTASAPATVTLLSDASASDGFNISYAYIILDLNGFDVNRTSSYGSAITVDRGGITVRGNGTVKGYYALSSSNSIVKVEGGTLEGSYYGISASGSRYFSGELHISGGTVNGGRTAINYSSLSAFTISGGTFRGKFYDNTSGGSDVQPVITGGSFPEGIVLGDSCPALSAFLGEGCYYYDADGSKVTLADGQKQIEGYVTVKKDISNATVDVTAPKAGVAKQNTVQDGTGYGAAITWDCDTEKFGYNTAYTATVTLTADENHAFTSDLTASGWDVVVSADGTTATLTKTFEATRKAKLTAISAPETKTLSKYYTSVADVIEELPTTVTYTAESGEVTVDIEWACSNYDHAVTKTNTFTWSVKDGELDNYDINGVAATGEITVTNASALTVNNSGENETITYNGGTYDVADMFTIDENAGEASYTIVGGTDKGTLNGSVLTITKAGTIEIKLTTAANGAYAAGEATATLTVIKGTGSGTVTIEGWTYGEYAKDPVISSTNGTAGVTYLYESTDGKGYTDSVAPENAGSYKLTVTFAETDLYKACTDDVTFTIEKANSEIGTVTAEVINDTLDVSAIVLNRTDTTVDGVLTVDAGQVLKLGDNEIAYTFTPTDTDNYEKVTGKVIVTVKDTIAPAGNVTLGANSWNEFLNDITFGLFFKETQTVRVEASDSFSGVKKIEYYATSEVLNLDSVKALADEKWTVMDGSVNVTAEDAKQFIYYIRITDKAGNVTYLSTNGAEYDTTAPVIDGVHNGVTYYTTQKVTVTDRNLDTVTLNGDTVIDKNLDTVMLNSEDVTDIITLEGDKETTYTIVATDKAGNSTTFTVTMKLTESVGAPLDGITEDNVTSDDKETIQDVIDQIDALLADEELTEDEKAVLEEIKEEAEMLIRKIRTVNGATDTENTEKVENVTAETVTVENKNDLENAKADLETALEENGGNYTEDEKKAIEDEIKRIDDALIVIENVEATEDKINNLPENITKDDTDGVDAAKKAYEELSDHEKTLIDPVVKAKLDDAVKAAEEANRLADINSPATGDTNNLWLWFSLLFISGGAVITLTVYDRKKRTVNSKSS